MITSSLKNQKDFDNVSKSSFKRRGSCFMLVISNSFQPREVLGPMEVFCFGMKVGKKISKKAVIRNKIKRRIRHIMRLIMTEARANSCPKAAIIIPYKGFDEADFSNILAEFKRLLIFDK